MFRSRLILPVICATTTWINLRQSSGDCEAQYREVVRHVEKKQIREAATALDQMARSNPNDRHILRFRGLLAIITGDPHGAILRLTAAMKSDSGDPVLFYGRGSAYRLLGRTAEAIADLKQAVMLDPGYVAASFALSDALSESHASLEAAQEAIRLLSRSATGKRPRAGGSEWITASTGFDLGRVTRVDLEQFVEYRCWRSLLKEARLPRRVVQISAQEGDEESNRKRTLVAAAISSTTTQNLDKCLDYLNEAIRHDASAPTYRLRALVRFLKGDLESAASDFSKVIDLDPLNIESYDLRGEVYFRLGHFQKGVDDRLRSIEIRRQKLHEDEGAE